jgi:tripartite ATP-independent transporter DctP family solute receptor
MVFWAILAVMITVLIGSPVAAQEIREHKMKLGYALKEDHPQGLAAKRFGELLAQKSGGKMILQSYGNNQLGDDKQMIGALQGGVQEFSIQATSPFVGTVKDFGMLDFFFLFSDEKQADIVLDGPVGQKLLAKTQDKGLVGLVFLENGFRNITNNKRPITRSEDIQGLKIRVMQSPVFIESMQQLGANPTPLAFSELYTALETGTVDGQENPFAIIESAKFAEVQKFLSVTNHVYNSFVLTASKKWWDKLNPAEQKLVREAALETREYQRKTNRELNAGYLAALQSQKMQINTVSTAELARMRDKVRGVADKFGKDYDQALLKEFQAAIDAATK